MKGEIEAVLEALNAANVRYLVVGGVAVVLHGFLRTTKDLDLVVQLAPDNLGVALRVLEDHGFHPVAPVPMKWFADPERRESWIRDKHLKVFSLWHGEIPTLKLDLLASEPFDFEEVYARALRVDLGRTTATVVTMEDLIAMKQQAGRPQDIVDIEALRELKGEQPASEGGQSD